jgi:vacuolar-type H+-ATPase subunit C/Vma6
MYDYGNARIAARRARLLDAVAYGRLSEAASPAALVAMLAGLEDWRPVFGEVTTLTGDPGPAIDAAIERHRSRRLAALPRWYAGRTRRLVEALVVSLDGERLLEVLRRRRAGESAELIGAAVAPGALLDASAVGALAREPSIAALLTRAAAFGLLAVPDARAVARRATGGAEAVEIESALHELTLAARRARAGGRGTDAQLVRRCIDDEAAVRASAVAAFRESGAAAATLVERAATLARLDALARLGRRDPLGIGAVAGYVAAVEVQAIRLRAVLAGVAAGWSRALVDDVVRPAVH